MGESWPDHSAELARKAAERINEEVVKFQDGKIDARRLALVADVLSDVTQGLIPNDTWNVIYAVRGEAAKELKKAKR